MRLTRIFSLISVLLLFSNCFESDYDVIQRELERIHSGEEDVTTEAYCDHVYDAPVKGASEWQKPTTPLLLIPGVGGTMLHGNDTELKKLWLSYRYQNTYGIEYLSTIFDSKTSNIRSRFGYDDYVFIRNDFYGLCPMDNIDPDLIVPSRSKYFHRMINWATSIGYEPGKTLFGFPYDWRHSIRHRPTMDRLHNLILNIAKNSPNRKVDIVTHSMGGLVFKNYLGQQGRVGEYIRNWIPISTPWNGAAALGFKAMISGYNMDIPVIPGIGGLTERVANQLEMGWPSAFELLPNFDDDNAWGKVRPFITYNLNGELTNATTEKEVLKVLVDANVNNNFERFDPVERIPQPLDLELWNHAKKTRNILKAAGELITKESNRNLKIYNIAGENSKTKYGIIYPQLLRNLTELKDLTPSYFEVFGDGTVPINSSLNDGMNATSFLYIGEKNHQKMLESEEILNAMRHFMDLQCNIEGKWNITINDEPSIPSSTIITLNHTSKVISPRRFLLSTDQIAFIKYNTLQGFAKISFDCLSFSGDIGEGTWEGKRIIGNECRPLERTEKEIDHGKNVTFCLYGYWSSNIFVECEDGYIVSNGECKPEKNKPSMTIVIVVISVSVVVALSVLGFIFYKMRKKNNERPYSALN